MIIDSRASCIFILRSSERDCAVSDIFKRAGNGCVPAACSTLLTVRVVDHNELGMKIKAGDSECGLRMGDWRLAIVNQPTLMADTHLCMGTG